MNPNICNCCTINSLPCKKKPNKGSYYCSIHEKCQEKNIKNEKGLCPKNRYKENHPRQNIRTNMKAIAQKGRSIQTVDKRIELYECKTNYGLLLKKINECKENNKKLLDQIEHSNILKNKNVYEKNRNETVIRKKWGHDKNYELNQDVPMKNKLYEAGIRKQWSPSKKYELNKDVPLTDDADSSSFSFKNNKLMSNYHFMNANNKYSRFAFCG
jgi:hypothetical protein